MEFTSEFMLKEVRRFQKELKISTKGMIELSEMNANTFENCIYGKKPNNSFSQKNFVTIKSNIHKMITKFTI